jgi:hypothetical protein
LIGNYNVFLKIKILVFRSRKALKMGRGIIVLCLSLFVELAMGQSYLDMRHHSYREMKEYLQLVNNICPEQSRLYSIGKSVQGRDLLVLELGTSPGQDQVCFLATWRI